MVEVIRFKNRTQVKGPGSPFSEGDQLLIEAGDDAERDLAEMGSGGDPEVRKRIASAIAVRDEILSRPRIEPRSDDPLDLRLSTFPQTDLGNAERFVARAGGQIRYCKELGWLRWDGKRYGQDDAEAHVQRLAHECVRAIQREAAALKGSDRDVLISEATDKKPQVWASDRLAQWGRSSENRPRLNAIPEAAAAMLSVRPDALDADPFKLTVLNGTLHFRRPEDCPEGEDLIQLHPHDPADLITKLAPVIFDPDAVAPTFNHFFRTVQPESGQRRLLMAWAGLSLTGDSTEQKLVFNHGTGKNGKSTFIDTTAFIAGDYGDTVPIETFLDQGAKRKGSDASPDIAGLKGVRYLRTSEPEKNSKIAEALVKLVTGGEPLKTRHLNKGFFTLRPEFKLTISGNYRPQINGSDEGIKRRLILVPWPYSVPVGDIDKALPAKLRAEASGILNLMLDGLRDWLESGLVIPDTVKEATQVYWRDSDPLGQFLELCVSDQAGAREQSSSFYAVFQAWAKWSGEREWTQTGFSRAMKDRGYRTRQSNVMWWLDVRCLKTAADFDMPPDDRFGPDGMDDGGAE